ncbi:MAG: bifunctional riboflavin kinase/FAD synthetase [Candidatus Omnitrophica bacterium]|nr:bifunctional riboflavin kinase/FAD synthetase [Candidatus Omnitrophota bacterium]
MKIIYGVKNLKRKIMPTIITVGIFDGVHIGHQAAIKELLKKAKEIKAIPTVVTFDPHPAKVLKGKESISMLSSLNHRLCLMENLGIELCLVIRFTKRFAGHDTKGFIQDILLKRMNMKSLIVGEDFSFGEDNVHTKAALEKVSKEMGFKLYVVGLRKHNSRIISSSIIRHLIENGKLNSASKLLGRPISILGTVVRGRKRGRALGFRTANIDPHHEAIPPSGVYAAYTRVGNRSYKAVLNIGRRPTFGEKDPSIEVHIFGINKNLYGKDLEVYFHKRLRPERKFKSEDHLRSQIIKDAALAKKLLA